MTHVAIGDPYITLAQLKSYMGIPDANTAQDTALSSRISGACTGINRFCHRQFGRVEIATLRKFRVGRSGIDVDDIWDLTGITVTPYLGATAGTAWDTTTFQFEPLGGIVDQVPGWPYTRICYPYGDHPLMTAYSFGSYYLAGVLAKWGWQDIPEDVITSSLMLASMDVAAKAAPFGVAGFGDYAVRIRSNPMVQEKLLPYQIDPIQVAS